MAAGTIPWATPLTAVAKRKVLGMGFWDFKASEDREQWIFDPLVGVGPLRFGMSAQNCPGWD
ncbi:hypothetical protein [Streptomyces sp. YIM S03343]